MPNVTVEILTGRSMDQRRKFVEVVTDAVVEILGARRENVRICFQEIERHNIAKGGVLIADENS
jgi:4-oxalocrotonate tautomerase